MKTKLIFATIFLAGILLTSCSNRLVGTWTIQKYESVKSGQTSVSLTNIGTMKFLRNGEGEKNINYTIFGEVKEDNSLFKWKLSDKFINIDSQGSEFSKTWIIIKNNKKFQQWQTTDGSDQVVTLELKKQ